MEPNEPVMVHLVPSVYCQSYRLVWVNLAPPPPKGTTESLKCTLVTTDIDGTNGPWSTWFHLHAVPVKGT